GERATIKVQQIPQSPTQHLMEEIFEIRFDFDRYNIKPEYRAMIQQLVATTNQHRNVRISVVGHTDTMGPDAHNWALGGRRAQAVRDEMIRLGVPAGQIVAVSAGKHDLKIETGPNVPNRENRRVRVVKETHWMEEQPPILTERVVMN
ncbi:MAG: OmpA family protein, partial [Alphaproteobacteria bacterium]|nr:OmpA family protein [Alphaproteobacteria bacterium]